MVIISNADPVMQASLFMPVAPPRWLDSVCLRNIAFGKDRIDYPSGQSSGILSHMKLPKSLAAATMTITHFRLMCRHFGTTPALRDAILAGTGIDNAGLETAQTVSIGGQLRQIANLNGMLDPGWFLGPREQLHFSAHGAIAVAAQSAPTLADGLTIICNFLEVRLPLQRGRIDRHGDVASLVIEPTVALDLDPELIRPIMFINMISIRTLLAAMLAHPAREVEFAFTGPRPTYAEQLQNTLDAQVSFGGEADMMLFPAAWLAAPSAFADAGLYAGALANLNALAAARANPPRALRYRIEQMLAERPAGRLDAAACARALGLSRRTMTRRLGDEGTGFRQLLDADLRRRALAMVEAGTMTNARIADTLGYQNPTSFHRAMQRWTRPGA
jgi:AraC-like DNA-binding protein